MNQREIRRIATERAALMIDSCLAYGWEPDDLIAEIGQENVDKVAVEIGQIAAKLKGRAPLEPSITKKYVVAPGWVRSENDGGMHYVDSTELMRLYGIRPDECLVIQSDRQMHPPPGAEGLPWLRPQYRASEYDRIRRELSAT